MNKTNEQKIIDATFEIAQLSVEYWGKETEYDRDGHMKWVADQLKGIGFPTQPSWGVLSNE